jgi:hypothetical protein
MAAPNPNNPPTHPTLTGPGYTITGYNTPRPGALFSNRTVGPEPAIAGSHVAYRTTFTAQANQRIRRDIAQNSGVTTFNGWQQGNHPDPTSYEEILIFDVNVASTLSQAFAFTVCILTPLPCFFLC